VRKLVAKLPGFIKENKKQPNHLACSWMLNVHIKNQ